HKFKANLEFVLDRSSFETEHKAVEKKTQKEYDELKNPKKRPAKAYKELYKTKWATQMNEQQRTALKSIVNGTSNKNPLLIFGPPGSGKSRLLSEAINQLLLHYPHIRILVATPSNTAADALALKLLETGQELPKILRYNATSRPTEEIP